MALPPLRPPKPVWHKPPTRHAARNFRISTMHFTATPRLRHSTAVRHFIQTRSGRSYSFRSVRLSVRVTTRTLLWQTVMESRYRSTSQAVLHVTYKRSGLAVVVNLTWVASDRLISMPFVRAIRAQVLWVIHPPQPGMASALDDNRSPST